jgi:hypothetical protein
MNKIKLLSTVKYINPMEDEKGLTFTVIEISEKENWCKIQANINMNLKPVYCANLSDLELI